MASAPRPWRALWALVVGFFMILIDSTIVSVANPRILEGLHTDIDSVIWVTSAYLLTYATPLLITGRLGDRFGPKNLYLVGLTIFTLASLWCGLSGDIGWLITARAVQGLGAALMAPQTMAVITRVFPAERRGAAMGVWGAVAGVGTLVGPIVGGLIVDALGWPWIFFVNVPIGVVAFALAVILVPRLEMHPHRFDLLGVVLSAVGMFLLVFGIQEGERYDWGTIAGPISVWLLIIVGVVVLVAFVVWQRFNRAEPLLPLRLFRDRNFALANIGITAVGFTVTSFALPLVFYLQLVRGMTPTQSALMFAPMAVSIFISPFTGRALDRVHPRTIGAVGMVLLALSLVLYAVLLTPDQSVGVLLIPAFVLGIAQAGIWAPLSVSATRNLPLNLAGAGAGVYNATRQVGAVLGSASIAALIQSRLVADLPAAAGGSVSQAGFGGGALPAPLHDGFTAAMAQSILLPAAGAIIAFVVVLFLVRPGGPAPVPVPATAPAAQPVDEARAAEHSAQ
ncbi:MFS transporter [Pseudolysinimonas kribbensis]|jgi:EmrB/QacA subfamily drug resistance transporter|uniref:MFS transporter n=1 Tax=Pseudolysinimonas kribbensis TaxID=433641 RepID=A0ABQ6K3J6_9MICO|nr:DHA2 family efflux MFS transporter permease subunit [Pseudolysinimonas kribbensis]GMA95205.1 MFS transporter [Pseudolysinimonas kribbensis]